MLSGGSYTGPLFFLTFSYRMSSTSNYYDTETELSAVNSILGSIGQAPVSRLYQPEGADKTLKFINPEISFIYQLLQEVNTDVQNEGWVFNREDFVKLTPDGNSEIVFPVDVLRYDVSDNQTWRTTDVVKREGKLYDKIGHTFKFTRPIFLNVVKKFSFEDLPSAFKRYITVKASTRAATQLVANENLAKMLNSQEAIARASVIEYECNQGDHNYMGFPQGTVYRTFQPFTGLSR